MMGRAIELDDRDAGRILTRHCGNRCDADRPRQYCSPYPRDDNLDRARNRERALPRRQSSVAPLRKQYRFLLFDENREVELVWNGKSSTVVVKLNDFSVFYTQDSIANAEANLKDKQSKIVVDKGQIVKVGKDEHGIVSRETPTKNWTDWIDYWAVDFNFENKREMIRVQNAESGEWEEVWTGDYIFENGSSKPPSNTLTICTGIAMQIGKRRERRNEDTH